MTSTRRLVMEDSGFNPSSMFTEEQIEKMRSMRPNGRIADRKKDYVSKPKDERAEMKKREYKKAYYQKNKKSIAAWKKAYYQRSKERKD